MLVDDRSPRWRYLLRHGLENVGDERTPWTDVVIIPVPVIVHGPVTKFCKGSLSRLLEREFPPKLTVGANMSGVVLKSLAKSCCKLCGPCRESFPNHGSSDSRLQNMHLYVCRLN